MMKDTKLVIGILVTIGGVSYIGYLHSKINELSSMVQVAVDDLATKTEITISDDILDRAIQKAVDREVSYISTRIARDLNSEIRSEVKNSVDLSSVTIKSLASKEIERQVRNIDISDMEKEVVDRAKDAIAEKFDTKLDGILDDFNDQLQSVQKIYSSIAKSMARD